MEIKCSCCQVIPEIDIYDNIQGIKFICKDKNNNIKHYGLFSINNFYKYFVQNNESNNALDIFIKQVENNNNNIPSIANFKEFIKKFDDLLIKLNKTYENLKEYFYKILFIKAHINNKREKENEKDANYYSFLNIINKIEETINYINNTMLIKKKFPKILSNDEINIKLDEILKLEGNKSKINIDQYKRDFEYKNSMKSNLCLKKLVKFENDENYVGSFIKLNEALSPAYFIYSYQIKNVLRQYSTFFQIYTKNLNLLMNQFICPDKILQILQLKDNNILLKLKNKAIIIKLDIDKKKIETIQEINSDSKLFIETLININNTENVSLLLQTNSNNCLYKDTQEKIYIFQQENFTTKIKGDELFFIDKNNFISLFRRDIRFYEIIKLENKNQFDLIKRKRISTNYSFLSGIQFIGKNKQYVIIGSTLHLFILSCKYKEIITIFSYYRMEIMHKGINDEVYICLNDWISGHKIIRQININNDGELIVEGNNYFEKFDFYNKNGLIDLGDTICYIEDNNKE